MSLKAQLKIKQDAEKILQDILRQELQDNLSVVLDSQQHELTSYSTNENYQQFKFNDISRDQIEDIRQNPGLD